MGFEPTVRVCPVRLISSCAEDIAPKESFFGHMKDEIDLKSCITLKTVKKRIDNYIRYYNANAFLALRLV